MESNYGVCPRKALTAALNIKSNKKMKKRIFAIPAKETAMPVKPNMAATIARKKKANVQPNIIPTPSQEILCSPF
jgi:hypothetical protein